MCGGSCMYVACVPRVCVLSTEGSRVNPFLLKMALEMYLVTVGWILMRNIEVVGHVN